MKASTTLVVLLLLPFLTTPISHSTTPLNFRFNFTSFGLRNLTILGDSYLRNGVIGLTRELGVPSSSSGTIICSSPITFFDPESNISASFATRFSFSITNASSGSYGDGLTFFISPDDKTLGSSGGYLGLVNSTQLVKSEFFAVEFDTRMDALFEDLNDNHVGVDVGDLNSIKMVNLSANGIDLKSGRLITAWVDYKNEEKAVKVWMSYLNSKPETPILRCDIDLSSYFKEFMYVGFSASTEGSTERHLVQDWTFETSGFHAMKKPFRYPAHNVSDNSATPTPKNKEGHSAKR